MHHMDANKMHREKARWELYKNAERRLEEILEETPHKTAAVWPSASHLTHHSSKINKTYEVLMEKQGQTHKWHSLTDSCTWTCQCWQTSKKSVWTQDAPRKTCQEKWIIGMDGKKESGNSMLSVWFDDIYIYIYIWKKIMDSNPTVCEEKLTSNPNRKGRFIEKQSRHYSVSVLLNHHQVYEGLY